MKNKYKVLNPIAWGGRKERGEIVEMSDVEASNFPNNLLLESKAIEIEENKLNEPRKDLSEMSKNELKEEAEKLGLSSEGSKADLLERITLFNSDKIIN